MTNARSIHDDARFGRARITRRSLQSRPCARSDRKGLRLYQHLPFRWLVNNAVNQLVVVLG